MNNKLTCIPNERTTSVPCTAYWIAVVTMRQERKGHLPLSIRPPSLYKPSADDIAWPITLGIYGYTTTSREKHEARHPHRDPFGKRKVVTPHYCGGGWKLCVI